MSDVPADPERQLDALEVAWNEAHSQLHRIEVHICELCLSDVGGECHVPGCVFWMQAAPTGAFLLWLRASAAITEAVAGRDGGGSDEH